MATSYGLFTLNASDAEKFGGADRQAPPKLLTKSLSPFHKLWASGKCFEFEKKPAHGELVEP